MWSLASCHLKARLVERKVYFRCQPLRVEEGRGQVDICPEVNSPHWQPVGQELFLGRRRGLHEETAQSTLTVIFKLVIGGLTNILVVLGIANLQFWRRQWHPTPVLLPGKSHERRSLVGCSPWGHEESDMTERLHFHFSLPCTGEGNGNPLQCSCLENPRDGRAWWAAIYGVAQSRTRLKQLSSSSSRHR